MADAKSTTKRQPLPHSREGRYLSTVALLRQGILPTNGDIFMFTGTALEEDKHLFSLEHLRSCETLSLAPFSPPPPRRPPKIKHRPIRQMKVNAVCPGQTWRPFIRLAGRWVEEAGFHIGDLVTVKVDPGRLSVELVPDVVSNDLFTDPVEE